MGTHTSLWATSLSACSHVPGVAAYGFLRSILPAGLPVLVGAICYQFSTLTILKLSQNSMSFAVFIVIPFVALSIRCIRRGTSAWCFLALVMLIGAMLNYMFLQKAAYALMFAGAYSAWRSYSGRSWRPSLVFALAVSTAIVLSFPRVLTVGLALVNSDAQYRASISRTSTPCTSSRTFGRTKSSDGSTRHSLADIPRMRSRYATIST